MELYKSYDLSLGKLGDTYNIDKITDDVLKVHSDAKQTRKRRGVCMATKRNKRMHESDMVSWMKTRR